MGSETDFLKELQKEFLDELQFLLEACEESYLKIENPKERPEELAKIFRLAHSIKGAGAAVGFTDLASFAHLLEDCLVILRNHPELVDTATISILLKAGDAIKSRIEELRLDATSEWDVELLKDEIIEFRRALDERAKTADTHAFAQLEGPPTPLDEPPVTRLEQEHGGLRTESTTIKVDSARVESLLTLVGELVVLKSQILNEALKSSENVRLNTVASLLDKSVRELQDRTLSMRMTPLKSLFLKIQRVGRDLSVKLKKPVEFLIEGEDIEIDRNMVEQLSDPLVHIMRNCMDHGIESRETRVEQGKAEKGRITLSAVQSGGRVVIQISDDGAGINRHKVLKKASAMGLIDASIDVSLIPDGKVFEFLFLPGFSTAEQITDISGRGVGMDVVKESLERLKGRVDVESTLGKGTCFKISLPITTAITDGMLVSVEGQTYILPMYGIRELVDLGESGLVATHTKDSLLKVRGNFFPLFKLKEYLRSSYHELFQIAPPRSRSKKEMFILYEHETGFVALQVDAVLGQAQVVMKPLADNIKEREGISGAAILGDGKVALLLDVSGMVHEILNQQTA